MTLPCLLFFPSKRIRMQLNGNQASPRSSVIAAQINSEPTREIELYAELTAFAEMTAEEQHRYLNQFVVAPAETAAEPVFDQPEEPADVTSLKQSELAFSYQVVEPDLNSTPFSISVEADVPSVTGAEPLPAEPAAVLTDGFFDDGLDIIDLFEMNAPFGDLELDYLGRGKTRSICPACEAEQGSEELFCAECGSFLNGISSTPASSQSCPDCGESVSTGELFCPWCGSVLDAVDFEATLRS
jgi:Double zinc ribbon